MTERGLLGLLDLIDIQEAIGRNVLGLVLLLLTAVSSFGAGYMMRASISRKRRAKYRMYEPYLKPTRRNEPPAFLIRPSMNANAPSSHRSRAAG
jgi:hypothetical protein